MTFQPTFDTADEQRRNPSAAAVVTAAHNPRKLRVVSTAIDDDAAATTQRKAREFMLKVGLSAACWYFSCNVFTSPLLLLLSG